MKRILLSVVTMTALFSVVSANAGGLANQQQVRASGCNYREFIHIQGPVGTKILGLKANVIRVEQSTTTDFQMIGTCETGSDGSVVAKIGTDENHYAEITIQDGQLMWNPEVTNVKSVGEFNYTGFTHPVGTFEYTYMFSKG